MQILTEKIEKIVKYGNVFLIVILWKICKVIDSVRRELIKAINVI